MEFQTFATPLQVFDNQLSVIFSSSFQPENCGVSWWNTYAIVVGIKSDDVILFTVSNCTRRAVSSVESDLQIIHKLGLKQSHFTYVEMG